MVNTGDIMNPTDDENDDTKELREAGLGTLHTKPSEKAYNEWLTTFSDDSLFDEMTENLNKKGLTNTGDSPEQSAAEGLLMLRNPLGHESNEILMPVDAPRLPDLVLEMDANKNIVNTEKIGNLNGKTNEQEPSKTKEGRTTKENINETSEQQNSVKNTKDKTITETKTKSPSKGVFQI